MLVPDRLSSSWSTYHRDVIHREGLVASDGKRWRIPAIQSERRIAETNCVVQQRYVGCHVLDARTSFGIDNQFPQAVRPSDRPTVRLWRTPPLAGRYKRGSGLRTRHRSGRWAATPCARASPPSGKRRALPPTDDPSCPPTGRRA